MSSQPAAAADRRVCQGCDSHVTADFGRVFGPEDGPPLRCLGCATHAELRDGAAADPDHERRVEL